MEDLGISRGIAEDVFFRRWARDAEISRGWISSRSLKQIWRARGVAEIEQGFENGRPVFKHSQGHGSYGRRPTFLDGSLDELETIEARVGANRRLGTKRHTIANHAPNSAI